MLCRLPVRGASGAVAVVVWTLSLALAWLRTVASGEYVVTVGASLDGLPDL